MIESTQFRSKEVDIIKVENYKGDESYVLEWRSKSWRCPTSIKASKLVCLCSRGGVGGGWCVGVCYYELQGVMCGCGLWWASWGDEGWSEVVDAAVVTHCHHHGGSLSHACWKFSYKVIMSWRALCACFFKGHIHIHIHILLSSSLVCPMLG